MSQSLLLPFCLGAFIMLLIAGVAIGATYLGYRLYKRHKELRVIHEMTIRDRLNAKYGLPDMSPRGPTVMDGKIVVKIANCATNVELDQDNSSVRFMYNGKQLLVTRQRDLHIWMEDAWVQIGDRTATDKLIVNMQPKALLVEGKKSKSNNNQLSKQAKKQKPVDDGDDDEYPMLTIKRCRTWATEDKRWTNRPGNSLPDGYRWRQFKGGQWGIEELEGDDE